MAEMSKIEQAKSILSTIGSSLKNKKVLADTATVEQRLAVCEGCPRLSVKEKRGKTYIYCSVCGCGYKKKVAFSGSACPEGLW